MAVVFSRMSIIRTKISGKAQINSKKSKAIGRLLFDSVTKLCHKKIAIPMLE